MSNWSAITIDTLKTSGHAAIITAAQTAGVGGVDPVAESIADAVSRVRAACSAGNQLDADTAAVPNSLKGLTIRLALYSLMERIHYPLSADQRDSRKEDAAWLLRISNEHQRFEQPDTAAGNAEMQPGPGLDVITQTDRHIYTRHGMEGL